MDVPPYISSGASSRAFYSLVRKAEYADSSQAANKFLFDEVEAIRRQLTDPALSLEQCRKHLIILLYCRMTLSYDFLPPNTFDFALSHAVTLAEAGRSISQKRIGYLFCAELMPADHELQLMLINTLRKDLEHEDMPRICLALEHVIASSNQDLIPAIQTRLDDLLSHNSPHVRRRALLAYRSLSLPHLDLLSNIGRKVISRCKDSNQEVVGAALSICARMTQIGKPIPNARDLVNDLFATTLTSSATYNPEFICTILSALSFVGLSEDNIPILLRLIRSSSKSHERGILRGSFALLANIAPDRILSADPESPVQHIRSFLTSHHPNDVYLFLSCLECTNPILWAGTSNDLSAVLDGWEVERIMQSLDFSDVLVRKMTLRLLHRVEPGIVSTYSQAVQNIPSALSVNELNERALRFLEIITIQSGKDGEFYAQELKDVLLQLEQASLELQPVLEMVVDAVLTCTRHAGIDFGIGFSTTILAFLVDAESRLAQTMMVIIAAIATEQCGRLSIRPLDILEGFASRLSDTTLASVKDACILAMLRIAADCDDIPPSVINVVIEVGHHSKRHLRQRCEQFTSLVANKDSLKEIVKKARSSSLPDFLVALSEPSKESTSPAPPTTSRSPSPNKLRYDAYEAPIPAPKLRNRDVSTSPQLTGNTQWDRSSDAGCESLNKVSLRLHGSSPDSLSQPLTPGELTLGASWRELDLDSKDTPMTKESPVEDLASRVELISLDSPFVSEPSDIGSEKDFESLWNLMENGDARGWFNGSVGVAVERMQRLSSVRLTLVPVDHPPYLGDLKVIVYGEDTRFHAALRLRESDDDSCLWRLRCSDSELHDKIKKHLDE